MGKRGDKKRKKQRNKRIRKRFENKNSFYNNRNLVEPTIKFYKSSDDEYQRVVPSLRKNRKQEYKEFIYKEFIYDDSLTEYGLNILLEIIRDRMVDPQFFNLSLESKSIYDELKKTFFSETVDLSDRMRARVYSIIRTELMNAYNMALSINYAQKKYTPNIQILQRFGRSLRKPIIKPNVFYVDNIEEREADEKTKNNALKFFEMPKDENGNIQIFPMTPSKYEKSDFAINLLQREFENFPVQENRSKDDYRDGYVEYIDTDRLRITSDGDNMQLIQKPTPTIKSSKSSKVYIRNWAEVMSYNSALLNQFILSTNIITIFDKQEGFYYFLANEISDVDFDDPVFINSINEIQKFSIESFKNSILNANIKNKQLLYGSVYAPLPSPEGKVFIDINPIFTLNLQALSSPKNKIYMPDKRIKQIGTAITLDNNMNLVAAKPNDTILGVIETYDNDSALVQIGFPDPEDEFNKSITYSGDQTFTVPSNFKGEITTEDLEKIARKASDDENIKESKIVRLYLSTTYYTEVELQSFLEDRRMTMEYYFDNKGGEFFVMVKTSENLDELLIKQYEVCITDKRFLRKTGNSSIDDWLIVGTITDWQVSYEVKNIPKYEAKLNVKVLRSSTYRLSTFTQEEVWNANFDFPTYNELDFPTYNEKTIQDKGTITGRLVIDKVRKNDFININDIEIIPFDELAKRFYSSSENENYSFLASIFNIGNEMDINYLPTFIRTQKEKMKFDKSITDTIGTLFTVLPKDEMESLRSMLSKQDRNIVSKLQMIKIMGKVIDESGGDKKQNKTKKQISVDIFNRTIKF